MTDTVNPYRLDPGVRPQRYDIRVEPDLAASRFATTTSIALEIAEPTSTVVLNSIDLTWLNTTVTDAHGSVDIIGIEFDVAYERATVTLARPVAGSASITVRCEAPLDEQLRGFYRSVAVHPDGSEHVIGSTQCQATDARRIFPCCDEPAFKAVFAITMVIEPHLTAISNWPEIDRTPVDADQPDGKVAVRFGDTMPMSSYLVAWTVGELEITEPVMSAGVPVRVVHVPGKASLTPFAIECAVFALQWLRDYYDLAVPCPKVDLVGLPDFAAGAMENPGCITFREALLLVDRTAATQAEQRLVADVISHELAHLWFGDLVTMSWWNGIWLNEAFATFMEVSTVEAWRPDWKRWEHFGLERAVAMATDSLLNTRPIEFPVVTPADADGMFDVITYQKGGAVLRMLQQWLGEDSFRDGVQRYLTDHQFGSTEVTDLWDALTTESGRPVRDVMDAWIWQPGYPVVSASLDGGIATLQQRRFSLSPTPPATWPIPVIAAVGTAPSTTPLLSGDPLTIDVGSNALRANVGGHGVYRVRYDDELTARLLANIAQLDALERFGVVDDAWAAVLADHLDIGDWISMLDAFVDDDELAVWQVIVAGLAWCRRLVPDSGREALQQRIAALIRPGVARLGRSVADTDADVDRERRGLLLTALGNLADDSDTIAWARGLAGAEDLDPALAASVLSIVVAHDDGARWAATHDRFLRADSPQEQLRYLYALADFPGRTAMDATLTAAFTDARPQDAPYLLRRCLEHRDHGPIAWATITQRWDEITTRFPPSSLVRMIGGITYLLDETLRRDIADFFDAHPIPQGAGTLRQHLERHTVNVAFAQRARGQLAAVFSS